MVVPRFVLLAGLVASTLSHTRAGAAESTPHASQSSARPAFPSSARLIAPAGVTQVFAGPAGASQMVAQLDPDAPRDVIVRFAAAPLGRRARLAAEVAAARAPYQRFVADLAMLEGASPGARAVVKRRFEASYNGVALRAPRALVERI